MGHLKSHCISIHALLAESDVHFVCAALAPEEFLSTLSLRRATYQDKFSLPPVKNFYPRSPCGERHRKRRAIVLRIAISIHALLAESDSVGVNSMLTLIHFYPRSPCGERLWVLRKVPILSIFLSTLSLRRATGKIKDFVYLYNYFYPRSPCGERLQWEGMKSLSEIEFLSTLSLRRATYVIRYTVNFHAISIHALLAESDC